MEAIRFIEAENGFFHVQRLVAFECGPVWVDIYIDKYHEQTYLQYLRYLSYGIPPLWGKTQYTTEPVEIIDIGKAQELKDNIDPMGRWCGSKINSKILIKKEPKKKLNITFLNFAMGEVA